MGRTYCRTKMDTQNQKNHGTLHKLKEAEADHHFDGWMDYIKQIASRIWQDNAQKGTK